MALLGAIRAVVRVGRAGLRGEEGHLQLVLELGVVDLHLLAHSLLPLVLEVEEDILAEIFAGRVRALTRRLFTTHSGRGTYIEGLVGVGAAEPGLELLVELPVFAF